MLEVVAVRVHLLGRFAVEVDGRAIPATAWRKRRPVEVLATLALAQGHALHREELIDRLWPDKDLEAGANNLHRALYDLRRIVGDRVVSIDRGAVRLLEDVWIDVEHFERAAAAGSPDSLVLAVQLYVGDLLPDDPYSDGLVARRESLRQRFVDAALKLANHEHTTGRMDEAIVVLRRLLTVDKVLEPAHQMIMRVLAESGRPADALRQFGECTAALRERLDVPPSSSTLELKAAIERGELRGPPKVRASTIDVDLVLRRMLGRDSMRAIRGRTHSIREIERVVRGHRGVLLLIGEAGLGKTRLAAECARLAGASGAKVLAGLGSDLDEGVPYAPFADAWAHHRQGTKATIDPFVAFVPSGRSAQEDRLHLFQAIERSVETLAGEGTLCLILDDLHQADPSSLQLFHHLARATRRLPLLLVGALREEGIRIGTALHTLVGSLGRERLAHVLTLEKLDRDAIAELVDDVLGGSQADEVSDAVQALAEGNPFYAEEVARAMRDRAALHPFAPTSLLDMIRHRVRGLGRDTERLLVAAAVAGHRFAFEIARMAAGLQSEPALDALELGVEARVLEEDGDHYRFRHALTRHALLEALTHARRTHLHRELAQAYESSGHADKDAETLARHHEEGGQPDRAIPFLLSAADRAQRRLGLCEAIAFLERARHLMSERGLPGHADGFRVLRGLGGMRLALSDLDGAVRDLDDAALCGDETWRPSASDLAAVRRIAALALIQSGRLDAAQARLELALADLGATESAERSAVLYHFAQLRWHQEKFAEARELAERCLAEAVRHADRPAMAKGHEMLALAYHSLGDWTEGRDHETQRQALAAGPLDVDQAFDVHLCLWEYHLYDDRDRGGVHAAVDRALAQAQRMGARRAIALCRCFEGALDFQAGRWDRAEVSLREAVTLFRQVDSSCGESLALQRLGDLLTARGKLEDARAMLEEAINVGGRAAMRSHCLTRAFASLTRNRLADGDFEGAWTSLHDGLAEAKRHGHCATCSSLLLPEAVRVELEAADVEGAESHAKQLEDVSERFGSEAWKAMARQARARCLIARGHTTGAFEALELARHAFVATGQPYEAARCRSLQAQLREDATLRLEATAEFAALGAAGIEV